MMNGSTQLEGVDVDETFSLVVKLGMFLSQCKYAVEILERAHMANCNPSRTPVDTEYKLGDDGDPVSDSTLYQSLSSKRKPTLSRSSVEAEYRCVPNAVAETCWLKNLLRELHTPLSSAMFVYCDNVSTIYLSSNPVQHQRTKHIEIDIHFVRDLVTADKVFYMDMRVETSQAEPEPVRGGVNEKLKLGSSSGADLGAPGGSRDPDECFTFSRYKARLMTNGSIQLERVDVDETFSSVVKLGTIQTVLSLATSRHWSIHQLDVKNSFLHGDLSETVYMYQSLGMQDLVHRDYLCLLQCLFMGSSRHLELGFSDLHLILIVLGFIMAEYCDVANAIAETCCLRNLLRELHTPLSFATLVIMSILGFLCQNGFEASELMRAARPADTNAPLNVRLCADIFGADFFLKETAPQVVPPKEGQPCNVQALQAVEAWKHLDFLCHNYILNGLVGSLCNVYYKTMTAKELWESLERKYKTKDAGIKKFTHKRKEMCVEDLVVRLRIEDDNKMARKNTYTPNSAKANMVEHDGSSLKSNSKAKGKGKGKNDKKRKGKVEYLAPKVRVVK
uniref:Ribonuclease H-like domain-containing protein n=1 Tax=Tanacetum cinerariifolium TaxID=118510 RepID=A0A6L2JQ61_TANCI|nr:ribonuclease H-like domain-containing protein [Tanacetum cinerariifolium]